MFWLLAVHLMSWSSQPWERRQRPRGKPGDRDASGWNASGWNASDWNADADWRQERPCQQEPEHWSQERQLPTVPRGSKGSEGGRSAPDLSSKGGRAPGSQGRFDYRPHVPTEPPRRPKASHGREEVQPPGRVLKVPWPVQWNRAFAPKGEVGSPGA